MVYYSPLRYPGGKRKIYPYVKELIKKNSLDGGIYVEPYAGGASVALSLLFNEYVSKVIINDIDQAIYAFWHSVLNNTKKLCEMIEKTPVTVAEWKKQKKIQKQKKCDLLTLGFSTFFLNRTNISGILHAGIIGGFKQKGLWKIDARYNKANLIERIKRIALYKNRIELYNMDAIKLVKLLRNSLPSDTLFYFDPPYYTKGKSLYLNYYDSENHQEISLEIQKIQNQKWIITYDNVKPIKNLYQDYKKRKFSPTYTAGAHTKGEEIMIFSNNIHTINSPIYSK